jgi:hypothetical protein
MINLKYKKAFSMMTAIIVIVVMASVTMLIMNITGKTIKATTQQYQQEQAQLLARSYTELAIMYVMHYDRVANNNCLESITDHFGESGDDGYDIKINIRYIGNSLFLPNCANNNTPTWNTPTPTGFDATISLVIDTFVTYRDFDDITDRNITFYRRTLQKI